MREVSTVPTLEDAIASASHVKIDAFDTRGDAWKEQSSQLVSRYKDKRLEEISTHSLTCQKLLANLHEHFLCFNATAMTQKCLAIFRFRHEMCGKVEEWADSFAVALIVGHLAPGVMQPYDVPAPSHFSVYEKYFLENPASSIGAFPNVFVAARDLVSLVVMLSAERAAVCCSGTGSIDIVTFDTLLAGEAALRKDFVAAGALLHSVESRGFHHVGGRWNGVRGTRKLELLNPRKVKKRKELRGGIGRISGRESSDWEASE